MCVVNRRQAPRQCRVCMRLSVRREITCDGAGRRRQFSAPTLKMLYVTRVCSFRVLAIRRVQILLKVRISPRRYARARSFSVQLIPPLLRTPSTQGRRVRETIGLNPAEHQKQSTYACRVIKSVFGGCAIRRSSVCMMASTFNASDGTVKDVNCYLSIDRSSPSRQIRSRTPDFACLVRRSTRNSFRS